MNFKIEKVVVLLSSGTDMVILHTDLPPSMPNISQQKLTLTFNTRKDTGVDYVRNYFNIEPEVIR